MLFIWSKSMTSQWTKDLCSLHVMFRTYPRIYFCFFLPAPPHVCWAHLHLWCYYHNDHSPRSPPRPCRPPPPRAPSPPPLSPRHMCPGHVTPPRPRPRPPPRASWPSWPGSADAPPTASPPPPAGCLLRRSCLAPWKKV